ncbi:MAG: 4-(cytidine 5'-diphospho)-2-C-methyl-D-erythritol kinase [Spirochaetaceae bacterium]|nr:4-(cytidine 5'-diphospho)-2-C-methyl-D-erythritol kinase [Spirochaetaceae bacterium]
MSSDIRVLAPAKINIGLRVLPVRKDGFHGIESVFLRIPLYDILTVRRQGFGKNTCVVECEGMVLPEDNTLTKAYSAFCKITGVTDSVFVYLEKKLPAGAGLGAGSSDAASLVNALEKIFDTELTVADRMQIASVTGSDVFFFMDSHAMQTGCAVVSGRGEIVEAIPSRQDLFFVMICPEVHSSTKEAYHLVDQWYAPTWPWSGPVMSALAEEFTRSVRDWNFLNSFTEPLAERYPVIEEALQDLMRGGAGFVQMSGSGSAVYGVFDSSAASKNALLMLDKKWKRCFEFASV